MTLRQRLGADVVRLHEQLHDVLDSEDGMIIFVDTKRSINYVQGFALSPCQVELLAEDIERAVRGLTRTHLTEQRRQEHEE
jgi:hypothetical protein